MSDRGIATTPPAPMDNVDRRVKATIGNHIARAYNLHLHDDYDPDPPQPVPGGQAQTQHSPRSPAGVVPQRHRPACPPDTGTKGDR